MAEHHMNATPREFRILLAKLETEASVPSQIPLSDDSLAFVHDIHYFIKEQDHLS